jgi:hypothetical protein
VHPKNVTPEAATSGATSNSDTTQHSNETSTGGQSNGASEFRQNPKEQRQSRTSDWPDPKPLPDALPPVAPFDYNLLPTSLRPWLQDSAERMQAPPDYGAVSVIVALASLVGRKIAIRPKREDNWQVVPNLWGAVIGRPGVMKSPATEQALTPLKKLEDAAAESHKQALAKHKPKELVETLRLKLTHKQIQDHLKAGDEESAEKEAEKAAALKVKQPAVRRYTVNDATVAKLGEVLSANPNGGCYELRRKCLFSKRYSKKNACSRSPSAGPVQRDPCNLGESRTGSMDPSLFILGVPAAGESTQNLRTAISTNKIKGSHFLIRNTLQRDSGLPRRVGRLPLRYGQGGARR